MNQNPIQMLNAFMEFKRNFTGDPEAEVKKLISSGRINQQQLNQLQQMAGEFQNLMNNFR